jgi:hypothetical protein
LLADRLSNDQRKVVGWSLFLVGALSSIPLALEVFPGRQLSARSDLPDKPVARARFGID